MRWRVVFIGCLTWLLAGSASAHDARPISILIDQTGDSSGYQVSARVPDAIPQSLVPVVRLPEGCEREQVTLKTSQPGATVSRDHYNCGVSIEGRTVILDFPGTNPSLSTIVRLTLAGGIAHSVILPPGEVQWRVPERAQRSSVALQYGWLGVKHIWLGIDHLLFVLCLLFVAGHGRRNRWQRILVTVTGFTVAHSLTLVLSALELVSLPVPAVEAVIALSIVFLALEICRGDPRSFTYRYPISVAASFGLLHGFGFASVLREIGLPQAELLVALLMFNLGVEAGQVLFIAVAIAVSFVARDLIDQRQDQVRLAVSYLVGGLASYWLIDRTLTFWQPV